ncbi:OsmC family protein, partial [Propionicimonas sp.]|uniref:OsmC family protein n=1 Tax=Propionicimonas sp. TaxID=1955623 RepID=UPI0039E43EAE
SGSTGAGYRSYDRAHRLVAIVAGTTPGAAPGGDVAAGDAVPDQRAAGVARGRDPLARPDATADGPPTGSGLALDLTADPAFLGSPDRLNPEHLVLAAASSCQLLSFLAEAALKRVDVLAYDDDATAVLDASLVRPAIVSIALHPRITVAPGTDHDLVRSLVDAGHRGCYIANSLAVPVRVTAEIVDAAS